MKKRTLRQLVENTERKDIYLKDYETYMRFFLQAREEGFHFGGVPFEKWSAKGRIVVIIPTAKWVTFRIFTITFCSIPKRLKLLTTKNMPTAKKIICTEETTERKS